MSYYSNDGFTMPAKDADVIAWYRDKPAPFPDIPRCSKSNNYGRSWSYHFSEEEHQQVRERQRQKKHVLEALKLNSGLRGPFNTSVREDWYRSLGLKRKMIAHVRKELAEGKIHASDAERDIKKYRDEFLRTIRIIRGDRSSEAPMWSPLCSQPFYVEPCNHHVPFDELARAEETVAFHRVYLTIPSRLFYQLHGRFRVAGRIKGYWSDKFDVDDVYSVKDKDKLVRCMFAFSDPEEVEKLEEEIVWVKMRY